jgi:superfamily II DNA or RNA helicase
MITESHFIVKGNASQYSSEPTIIRCVKKHTNGLLIPSRYHKKRKIYKDISFPALLLPLKPEQENVLNEMEAICERQIEEATKLYKEKGIGSLDENGKGVVACHTIFCHIHTGFGKSVISSVFAARKKGPVLMFHNRSAIETGLVRTWRSFFGIEPHIASGKELGKHDVCICSIQLAERAKFSREDYMHYKTVICDEADTLCTQNAVDVLLDLAPQYLIGMTATMRRDGLDKVLEIFWGPRKGWIQRLKEFGETCRMRIHVLYTPFKVANLYNRKNALDWTGMIQHVVGIHERNIMIRNLCILHLNNKILILTKSLDHTGVLHKMLLESGIDSSTYCGNARMYYDAHVLIATFSKAGRGYDDKQVSAAYDGRRFDVIILCMTQKDADQSLGRSRGDDLLVYLFVDDNQTMKSHCEDMKKINSKRGAIITEDFM